MPKKLDEDFYRLTPSFSKKLRMANLSAAEWKFWAYLTERDSWGDRYKDLNALDVMTECGMSKATYYRAKAKFQEEGLFDFQEEKVSFRNLNGNSRFKQAQAGSTNALENETTVSKMRLESQKCESESQKCESESQKCESESQKCESESPEPAPSKGSKTPQTLQTYSDLQDSLTLKTRESFEKFCFRKIEESSLRIASPQSWLKKHYLEYWEEFSRKHPEAAGVEKSSATVEVDEFMTAEYLQKIYGTDWKNAAAHFGIEYQE